MITNSMKENFEILLRKLKSFIGLVHFLLILNFQGF